MTDKTLGVGDAVFIDNGVLYPEDWEVRGVIILEESTQLSLIDRLAVEAERSQNELWSEWYKDRTKPYPHIWGVFCDILRDNGVKFCDYQFEECTKVSL